MNSTDSVQTYRVTWRDVLADWPAWGLIVLVGLATLAVYPRLPEQMPVHWNIRGEVDRWASRGEAVAVGLLLPAALYALMWVMPLIDPRRENYARHAGAYRTVRTGTVAVAVGVLAVQVLTAAGVPVRVERVVPLFIGGLFVVVGNVLGQVRHNYFFGIRTPWTLASEEVWRRTHRAGARVFVVGGMAMIAGALAGPYPALAAVAGMAAAATVGLSVYSYLLWRRLR